MGCFNKMGFYSHLPIIAGDEIVMFICVSDRFYLNNFAKLNNSYSQIIEKLYKRYDDIEETE